MAAEERTASSGQAREDRRRHLAFGLLGAILVVLVGWALREMAAVVIPVILAIFVTLAVLPLDRAIAARLPDKLGWLGRLAVMLLLLFLLSGFIGGLAYCVMRIASDLSNVSGSLSDMLPEAGSSEGMGGGLFSTIWSDMGQMIRERGDSIMDRTIGVVTGLAQAIANAMGVVIAGLFFVLFLVLLALTETPLWQSKLDSLTGGPAGSWRRVTETMGAALRRYIMTRAAVGLISASIYSLWLFPFGLDLILVWAILTFLMNFIPNLGAVISGVFPTLYAFFTLDPGTALLIGAGLVVIEQVIGNWIDPRMQGNQVALSPLVILIAVVFWGWLWGVAGAFLGTPMTLAIMILCNHVAVLRPIAVLLSNQGGAKDLDEVLGWRGDPEEDSAGPLRVGV
jgi:AI-2 transport protein TqsA